MKVRNVPYGYTYVDGELVLHPQESVIVSEIFQQYLAGKSLLKISEDLNEKGIEYRKGITNWNKARLKRIIEDERYLGKDDYPIIILKATYQKAQELKNAKNTQKNIDKKAAIFQINVPIRCPNCHNKMCRKFDHRFKNKVKWRCQSKICETLILKEDVELVQDITELLNEVIAKPEKLQVPIETKCEQSGNLRILDNEIARLYDSINIDKEELQKKLLKYASLRYIELNAEVCRTQRLKDRFKEASPTETFPAELFDKTVKELNLYTDGSIGIILMNDQEIKREG
jgi:phage integrase family site-specific recombinase